MNSSRATHVPKVEHHLLQLFLPKRLKVLHESRRIGGGLVEQFREVLVLVVQHPGGKQRLFAFKLARLCPLGTASEDRVCPNRSIGARSSHDLDNTLLDLLR
jgi:hypothetical protein